jgi:hypothetical protein
MSDLEADGLLFFASLIAAIFFGYWRGWVDATRYAKKHGIGVAVVAVMENAETGSQA